MRDSEIDTNPDEEIDLSDDDLLDLYIFEDGVFDIDKLVAESNNQRKSVRYIRNDIQASIHQADIFGSYSLFAFRDSIEVELLDISTKGALIASPKKLKMKKKVKLTLVFDHKTTFEISTEVVREAPQARKLYGLKFESINHDLGEHLLETQTNLIFK